MHRALFIVLLIGAVLGLLGQQAVAAASPAKLMVSAAAMPDCMEQMSQHPMPHEKAPCRDLSLACVFATGCAIPLELRHDVAPAESNVLAGPTLVWPPTAVFVGSELAPEPHPPTILA